MGSYAPNETSYELFLERTFVAGDFISGTGYGIQLVLFTACANYLWNERKTHVRNVYLLAYITVLLIVETIFGAVQARTVQVIYIDNRNYPGGPWAYFLATQYLAINVMFYATLFILTFLSDLLVLWRCWVIWNAVSGPMTAYLVTAFPALMMVASFILGTLWTLQSSQPGLSLYSKLPIAYGTSFYAISLGVNIILTVLITFRLLSHRRRIMASLPPDHARHYVSVASIIIESAALYSFCAILFLVTYAINNPINQVFLGLVSAVQQIATYLIIYRLANGRAWRSDTLTRPQHTLTTVQFTATPDYTEQTRSTSRTDTVQANLNVSQLKPVFEDMELKGAEPEHLRRGSRDSPIAEVQIYRRGIDFS